MRKIYVLVLLFLLLLSACNTSPDNQLIKSSKAFDRVYKDTIKDIDTNDLNGMFSILESRADMLGELKRIVDEINKI